ncbi:MAG: phosphomannomutase, partial [Selenomonas sp.]|nr:phosphomannomutase [Selenomonas sp.]
ADEVLARIEAEYGSQGKVTKIDGLSVEFPDWRFNLRKSNTEPVIRLNVETRHDEVAMQQKTEMLLKKIRAET